jgi:hypothetical protein
MSMDAGRVIASCFALAAFAVAVASGLMSDSAAAQILLRAVLAMIVCYPVGLIVGMICEGVIRTHLAAPIALDAQATSAPAPNVPIVPETAMSAAGASDAPATESRAAA